MSVINEPSFMEVSQATTPAEVFDRAADLLFVEVGQMHLGEFADDPFAREYYQETVRTSRLFVAVSEDRLVMGAAILDDSTDKPEITLFATAANCRRIRIGSKLLALLESTALEDGLEQLILHPTTDSEPFYQANGYERISDDPDDYTMGKLLK